MKKRFIRTDANRHSKLGKGRKKLLRWRVPKGNHNKLKQKRFGYPTMPSIGHRTQNSVSGLIKGKVPIKVSNLKDLENVDKKSIVILAKIGAKKKLEIIKKANEMKLEIYNVFGGQNATK